MKKNVLLCISLCIMAVSLSAVTQPAIEGRAKVAKVGELPSGMYIKAHSFLPGDSVIVTNLSSKVSVEVFVFGTIDEGVAAIVSPQVADKLFITENSDSLVQIRKVVATAVEAEKELRELTEERAEEEAIAEEKVRLEEEAALAAAEEVARLEELAVKEEEQLVVLAKEEDSTVEEVIIEPEKDLSLEDNVLLEELDATVVPISINEDSSTVEPVELIKHSTIYTPFSDMDGLFADQRVAEDITPAETIIEEKEEIDGAEILIPLPFDPLAEPQVCPIERYPDEVEALGDEIALIELVPATPTEEKPNVLVPTEANPPIVDIEEVVLIPDYFVESVEPVVETTTEEAVAVIEIIEEVSSEAEPIDIYAMTPATEYIEVPSFEFNIDEYLVDDIIADGSKRFYVQLASYKNIESINDIVSEYSARYPLALVKSAVKDAYQVLVGPLSNAEYTIVLERFKSYGYKDAFLKIVK